MHQLRNAQSPNVLVNQHPETRSTPTFCPESDVRVSIVESYFLCLEFSFNGTKKCLMTGRFVTFFQSPWPLTALLCALFAPNVVMF